MPLSSPVDLSSVSSLFFVVVRFRFSVVWHLFKVIFQDKRKTTHQRIIKKKGKEVNDLNEIVVGIHDIVHREKYRPNWALSLPAVFRARAQTNSTPAPGRMKKST